MDYVNELDCTIMTKTDDDQNLFDSTVVEEESKVSTPKEAQASSAVVQRVKVHYLDREFKEIELNQHGCYLRAHANHTILRMFSLFHETGMLNIKKPYSLINILIKWSEGQYQGKNGIKMSPDESKEFKNKFKDEKHHIIVAVNIFMFMIRHGLLVVDKARGRTHEWNRGYCDELLKHDYPII
jgi:hypothetical protein